MNCFAVLLIYTGNFSFVKDRFCCQNKAILFNNGYLQIPTGTYFSGDFSITAWIYYISSSDRENILFAGPATQNNGVMFLMYPNTAQICLSVYFNETTYTILYSMDNSKAIQLNQWYHVATTLKGTVASIYINGIFVTNATSLSPISTDICYSYFGVEFGYVRKLILK